MVVICTSTALVMLVQGLFGPVLPLYAQSLGVSAAAIGTALSAFALAPMLFNIPTGLAADRWG
ncbi:MAG TPA: MFS transporter [Dehalococcoidia bacterium]|nr:MFS transporter [Dehalococcoidia bacterium]